jgi:glycosyltransferase involved in cell wall biosynthesis
VPEVIEDGVSGFIVESEAEAVEAVRRLPYLDRRQVRAAFERRFSAEIMASHYVDLYERRCRVAPALPAWPLAYEAR